MLALITAENVLWVVVMWFFGQRQSKRSKMKTLAASVLFACRQADSAEARGVAEETL